MSKGGGAGKVYFVLYLAVVLELLIIIVERDEAEEHLLKKQKETMRIVESILQQLQSGSGTEGINTRPQDEITFLPEGFNSQQELNVDIKQYRKYIVEVGVTDITNELKWDKNSGESQTDFTVRLKKLVKLANVQEIEYQLFFNDSDDPNNAPAFISEDTIKKNRIDFTKMTAGDEVYAWDGTPWKFLGLRKLVLDDGLTYNNLLKNHSIENLTSDMIVPEYPLNKRITIGPNFAPKDIDTNFIFHYTGDLDSLADNKIISSSTSKKRSFFVYFEPPRQAGWYKLRFASQTNRILGVKSDANYEELPENTTVNIGTVQLTVKDLRKVMKELTSTLEKYRDFLPDFEAFARDKDVEKFNMGLVKCKSMTDKREETNTESKEMQSKIDLYGYIAKLLAPGQSINFDQNRGSIEFNIRVTTLNMPPTKPSVSGLPSYIACFDKLPPVFEFEIGPFQGVDKNKVFGRVLNSKGVEVAKINCTLSSQQSVVASASSEIGKSRKYIGTVDRVLDVAEKNYIIEITHNMGSQKAAIDSADLEIFPSKIVNEADVMNNFSGKYSNSYYGEKVNVSFKPASGNKLIPEQFRTYLFTDQETQPVPQRGFSNSVNCDAKSNNITLRFTWVQPFTNTEIDLYPQVSEPIKQRPPRINQNNKNKSITGPENRILVVVSGIIIPGSSTGSADKPKSEVVVDKTIKVNTDNLLNVKSSTASPVRVIEEGDDKYKFSFELSVKMADMKNSIDGNLSFGVSAYSINPVNNKSSDRETVTVTIPMDDFSPDGLGSSGGSSGVPGGRGLPSRGSGGGTPPPPGGGSGGGSGTPPPPGGGSGGGTPPPRGR